MQEYEMVEIGCLVRDAHKNAVDHGFYDDFQTMIGGRDIIRRTFTLAQLAKVAGEVGEVVDAIQRGLDDDAVAEELADIVIRVADLAGFIDVDLNDAVRKKMTVNRDRPYKHGKTC